MLLNLCISETSWIYLKIYYHYSVCRNFKVKYVSDILYLQFTDIPDRNINNCLTTNIRCPSIASSAPHFFR